MKTDEDFFRDWESHVFGFGYGSGEPHTVHALKDFLESIPANAAYDYEALEHRHGELVTWLFINILAHAGLLEYGTSPRYAWLSENGRALQTFVAARSSEQLIELTATPEDYVHCYPDHCNCDDDDCRKRNPFWRFTA